MTHPDDFPRIHNSHPQFKEDILREAIKRNAKPLRYPLNVCGLEKESIATLLNRMPNPALRFKAMADCLNLLPYGRWLEEATLQKILELGKEHEDGVPALWLIASHIWRSTHYPGDPDMGAVIIKTSRKLNPEKRTQMLAHIVNGRSASPIGIRAFKELVGWIKKRSRHEDLTPMEADECAKAIFYLLRSRRICPIESIDLIKRLRLMGKNRSYYDLADELIYAQTKRQRRASNLCISTYTKGRFK
jgi:hypothetical protein